MRCQILAYAAVDERNRAAAQALEVFYLLAEAEANRDILRRGVERADAMLNDLADLEKQGLTVPPDADSIRRQRLDLLDRQAQLELSLRQLNSQLRRLLGVESSEPAPFWPAADLRVVPEPIDYEAAVADGLAHRADVNLLRMLSQALSRRTVEAVRAGLSQISGVLGISVPAARRLSAWLGGAAKRTEVHARRHQLEGLLADRHRAAAEEIRQAAQTVETRLEQVVLAQSKVENWEKHVDSLKQLQGGPDGVTAFDLGAAELQLLEARSTLVHEVVAWRIAQVKLKQSQGLLSLECGYELPPLPCSGE